MRQYRNFSKVYNVPRRAFERERLVKELKLCGQYGLRCKKEIWRVQRTLGKLRAAARFLLTLPADDPRRELQGAAILRRCKTLGLLEDDKLKLDYVLALTVPEFLDRRLQTVVYKLRLALSVHHARCAIFQRHIGVGGRLVNVPSFMVRAGHTVHHMPDSPLRGAKAMGRVKRMKARRAAAGGGDEADDE